MKSEYLHIRIDSTAKQALKELADAENRTVTNFVEHLIKEYAKAKSTNKQ